MPGFLEFIQCAVGCFITALTNAMMNPENIYAILIQEVDCIFGCGQTYLGL